MSICTGKTTYFGPSYFLVIVTVTLSLHSNSVHARRPQVHPLLKCLGQEELQLHKKKDTGPQYRLNQVFINLLAGVNDIPLKQGYYRKICSMGSAPPSVALLKILLLKGIDIFEIRIGKGKSFGTGNQLSALEEIRDDLPRLFFNYLATIQAKAPTAGCLEKEIPEVAYYNEL